MSHTTRYTASATFNEHRSLALPAPRDLHAITVRVHRFRCRLRQATKSWIRKCVNSVHALADAIESGSDQAAKLFNADPIVPECNRIQPHTVDDHLPDGTDKRTIRTESDHPACSYHPIYRGALIKPRATAIHMDVAVKGFARFAGIAAIGVDR